VSFSGNVEEEVSGQPIRLYLPSIQTKALFASALSLAASCLSLSVTSLRSDKLRVDSAGEGTEEGGVVEGGDGEVCEDSLMLTISNTPREAVALLVLILFVLFLAPVRPNTRTKNQLEFVERTAQN
jgi:hypothetical protein